jgi:hypothetical protein
MAAQFYQRSSSEVTLKPILAVFSERPTAYEVFMYVFSKAISETQAAEVSLQELLIRRSSVGVFDHNKSLVTSCSLLSFDADLIRCITIFLERGIASVAWL